MSKCNHDPRNPFAPIKTTLGFPELMAVARYFGLSPSCGMCGHKFSLDDTTSDHECHPPLFQIEVVEVKPLPPLAAGSLFFLDYTYGKDVGGEATDTEPRHTLATLAEGVLKKS